MTAGRVIGGQFYLTPQEAIRALLRGEEGHDLAEWIDAEWTGGPGDLSGHEAREFYMQVRRTYHTVLNCEPPDDPQDLVSELRDALVREAAED